MTITMMHDTQDQERLVNLAVDRELIELGAEFESIYKRTLELEAKARKIHGPSIRGRSWDAFLRVEGLLSPISDKMRRKRACSMKGLRALALVLYWDRSIQPWPDQLGGQCEGPPFMGCPSAAEIATRLLGEAVFRFVGITKGTPRPSVDDVAALAKIVTELRMHYPWPGPDGEHWQVLEQTLHASVCALTDFEIAPEDYRLAAAA